MDDDDPTAQLLDDLVSGHLTLAVAESLTGGALTAELTRPAGASAVVMGGVVVYATQLKHDLLGVDQEILDEYGPVHSDVASQLAQGVRKQLSTDEVTVDIGVATTGVAGPGWQSGQSPGTVFIAVAADSGTTVSALHLEGSRSAIRAQTVAHAVSLISAVLSGCRE